MASAVTCFLLLVCEILSIMRSLQHAAAKAERKLHIIWFECYCCPCYSICTSLALTPPLTPLYSNIASRVNAEELEKDPSALKVPLNSILSA